MEKLDSVQRLRFTEEQRFRIQQFMRADCRERFEEAARCLVTRALDAYFSEHGNSQDVEPCSKTVFSKGYTGLDRRKSTR